MRRLLLGTLLLGGAGCGDAAPTPAEVCVHEPALSWENFGEAFMVRNCNACHHALLPADERNGAPLGVDFDTYTGTLAWAGRVEARATGDAPTMPPGGGLSAEEVALLSEWLACEVAADLAAEGDP